MRVQIIETVNIDVQAWATEYDIEPTPKAVRDDVKLYFTRKLQDWVDDMGLAPEPVVPCE